MDSSRYLINEEPIFFLPSLAEGIGINEAILLQKIHGWLQCTPKEHIGRNWIYNSYRSWHEQLPFMSETTIKRAMKNLIDIGVVITENFNNKSFDKTLWYSIDYKKLESVVKSVKNVETNDSVKSDHRLGQNGPTIVSNRTDYTNNNYNTKENINNINIINTKERFKKPTLQEVEDYCRERNSPVDARTFYDYFETGGWVDSKGNKVKNWKQKVITWERHSDRKETKEASVPDWFDKEYEVEELSDEERRLFDEVLPN